MGARIRGLLISLFGADYINWHKKSTLLRMLEGVMWSKVICIKTERYWNFQSVRSPDVSLLLKLFAAHVP